MMFYTVLFVTVAWLGPGIQGQMGETFPANEYEYSLRRDYLKEKEAEMTGNNMTLTQDEQIVDRYLQYLKNEHFLATKDTGFPPLMPIQEVLGTIRQTDVYRVLEAMPKGGNMHNHENHMLGKGEILDMLWASSDFEHLYILPENHSDAFTLDFFINPPNSDWVRVQGNAYYSKERILPHLHLIGSLSDISKEYPSDSSKRWNDINRLWGRCSENVLANTKIRTLHTLALYDMSMREGYQYLETRKRFRYSERIYELSTDPQYANTSGKRYLDNTGEYEINMTLATIEEYKATHPNFIGHNRITYSARMNPVSATLSDMNNALFLNSKFPNHMKGYDLVAEEDAGYSHLFYLENFLKLYDGETQQKKIELYLHTAETSFPGDLVASDKVGDPSSTAENAFDAILLGSKRVGHGLAYIKHPYLMQELKARDIAVEVCPVSNQLLGLQADIRNHPAVNYMKMGIPVILGADDPGTFGVDYLTPDWYEAFVGWGLTLKDLKKLARNSLEYSTMTRQEIDDAVLNKWTPSWNQYVTTIRDEACAADLTTAQPAFYRVLPRDGAITGNTNVHIFGRNFERAVCNQVTCRFGQSQSISATYVTNYHVICTTPQGPGVESTVGVSLSLNNGVDYFDTGLNFTYKHPLVTDPPVSKASSANGPIRISNLCWLSFICLCFTSTYKDLGHIN